MNAINAFLTFVRAKLPHRFVSLLRHVHRRPRRPASSASCCRCR